MTGHLIVFFSANVEQAADVCTVMSTEPKQILDNVIEAGVVARVTKVTIFQNVVKIVFLLFNSFAHELFSSKLDIFSK